uniref:FGENESH: predicted gene_3.317 protein n=1 Tax=Rhodotorula toruloides TaxID=5286 RepID=A0A0K3CBT4_RHOTO
MRMARLLLLAGRAHKIRHDARGEPVDDFSFERDVPSLRKLDITAYGSLAACAPGLSKLTHLTISSTEFAAAAIPWETLHYLDIGLLDLGEPDFIDSLQDVCKDSIHGIDSFADSKSWTFSARLPSVLHLKLGGCSNYDTTDALRGLRAFLDLCPAAQSLRLIGFQYYPDNPTNPRPVPSAAKEAILGSIRDKNLPFAFPAISALLFLLLQTSILDVYLELSTNGGIRWRRASCSEVFEGERWTVI